MSGTVITHKSVEIKIYLDADIGSSLYSAATDATREPTGRAWLITIIPKAVLPRTDLKGVRAKYTAIGIRISLTKATS